MAASDKLNLTMLCDFYELTMGNGYFKHGYKDRICYFDVFFRRCPDNGGFAIAAGLEQIIDYIKDLHFTDEDIAYLRSRNIFTEDFLAYLKDFQFTGDIWAVPEGTPIFPKEPIMTVRAPAIEAQLIETFILLSINHQSLIATKANRVVRAAKGRRVMEFGSRRAQGGDAAVLGARAAYIGGCHGTACTISDQLFGVRAGGTMAHAWVQMFDTEYEAFKAYCQMYPNNATLLVDTYNTLKSGVPNAIKAFNEVLKPMGITKCGIRLDSGDMAYLSRKARKMLDDAGWTECEISVSNSLDEYIIGDLLNQGAEIDMFGVGERLITARSEPVLAVSISWLLSRMKMVLCSLKSKSLRTPQKSRIRTLRSYIVSLVKTPEKQLQTICVFMTKQLMTAVSLIFLTPKQPGKRRLSMISRPRNCKFRSLRMVSWSISALICRKSANTVSSKWIAFGTRLSVSTIPTITMLTFLKNCGTLNMIC